MQNLNRRTFIKNTLLGSAALVAGIRPLVGNSDDLSHLCILHTNDTHSRIDPYPANDPRFPLMGGYARRSAVIAAIRKETNDVLLLDAGDIFQGTPYYNIYGGEPELRLMSMMGYDAATMGNHEFDNGLEGFLKVLPFARFPFVTSNYDFSDTILHGKTQSYLVIIKDNLRIGIYGLGIKLEGLVGRNHFGNTLWHEPVKVAQSIEILLKEEMKCDLIICLSHLGYKNSTPQPDDITIASNTRYTNIILGGHTHTLLDSPEIVPNAIRKKVYIGQTGYGGVRLGRMNVYFNNRNKETFVEAFTTKILKNQES